MFIRSFDTLCGNQFRKATLTLSPLQPNRLVMAFGHTAIGVRIDEERAVALR
ncbi:hypothetical protein [Hydrogenimonas sp.]